MNIEDFLILPNYYTSLDLTYFTDSEIKVENIKLLVVTLKENKTVTSIHFCEEKGIGGVNMAVVEALKKNKSVTSIKLNNNSFIGIEDMEFLAKMLKINKTITSVNLCSNQIWENGARVLAEALKKNNIITSIILNHNKIRKEGTKAIAKMLEVNKTIKLIELGYNQIYTEGAKSLAEALTENKTITSINLQHNYIKDEGAEAIAEMLKINKTLKSINLHYNHIGDQGAKALAEGLRKNKTVTSIDLYHNEIEDEGAKALIESLRESKTVTSINLRYNYMSQELAIMLAKVLEENTKLTILQRRDNQVDDKLKELNIQTPDISNQKTAIKQEVIEIKQEKVEVIDKVIEEENTDHKLNVIFAVENNDLHTDANIEIQKINDLIREGNHRLQGDSQQGILLLGKTGSGKSTLTHLLVGRELQAILDDETGTLVIDAMHPLQEISISHNKTSETKIPNKCQLGNLVIWDCPGFKDTDVTQEIANAFYIKKLCETTKQLKFVLVVSDSEITHNRGTSFVDTVNQMVKTFDNIEALNCSVSLVVTQAINSKQVQHIQKAIERISTQNEHIEPATLQMIAFLSKSVQIFRTPIDEGRVITKTDIMAAINSSTEYCDNNAVLANMSVSKEAIAHSKNLLQMASHNFNEILKIIISAIAQPNDCIIENNANNIFVQNHELVREWVPSSMHYSPRGDASKSYFMELDQLESLQNIFKSKQDNITSFEKGLDIVKQALKVFEKFSINHTEGGYVKILQEYAYVLTQQFEYIKFFSELCQKELPSIDGFVEVIKYCHNRLDNNLESQIKALVPKENVEDIAYYNKVIEYLNIYADDPACRNNEAKAYVELGNLAKDDNNDQQALEHYIEAIKCNTKLPEIYNKLGALFYEQGNYQQAIECYKVTNNAFKIKNCFKKWITQDEESADIRMEKGDYYASIGSYGKAKESYHNAFSLSEDEEFKSKALHKIADIIKNKTDLADHFIDMADNHNYNNFEMVDEQFIELIGQPLADINDEVSQII